MLVWDEKTGLPKPEYLTPVEVQILKEYVETYRKETKQNGNSDKR